MGKPPVDEAARKEMRRRSEEWRQFRRKHLFTQKMLADQMEICLRTLQHIEAGKHLCLVSTQRRFLAFKSRFGKVAA